jgi:tetratricopeptide (TPR) repeat protein
MQGKSSAEEPRGEGVKMTKILIGVIGCLILLASTAWSQDAMYYYDLGVRSTVTYEKINYFTKALELNPRLYSAYEKRGRLYYYREKYSKSIEDFRKFTDMDPHDSEAFRMLGLAYLEKGYYDKAIAHLTRAVELDPKLTSAYSHRAEAYLLKGRAEEAIEDASKAIALHGIEPIIGRAYTIRSKAYKQLGQSELAEADYDKAYTMDPENYDYRYFTVTDALASDASDSDYINATSARRVGLVAMIVLLFVVIFKVVLPAPDKQDTR